MSGWISKSNVMTGRAIWMIELKEHTHTCSCMVAGKLHKLYASIVDDTWDFDSRWRWGVIEGGLQQVFQNSGGWWKMIHPHNVIQEYLPPHRKQWWDKRQGQRQYCNQHHFLSFCWEKFRKFYSHHTHASTSSGQISGQQRFRPWLQSQAGAVTNSFRGAEDVGSMY